MLKVEACMTRQHLLLIIKNSGLEKYWVVSHSFWIIIFFVVSRHKQLKKIMSMGISGADLETYSQKAFLSDPDQDNWLAISSHGGVRLTL